MQQPGRQTEPVTTREALAGATRRIGTAGSSTSPGLDAQLLLARVLQRPRSWLYAWPDAPVTSAAAADFEALVARRVAGEPVAYLLGERDFWRFTLQVSPAVLIPRPETEMLVETALQLGPTGSARVADLGTGSGAIALALAHERPAWRICATDLSEAALAVARANADALAVTGIEWLAGSWTDPLPAQPFDLIVSNPPYIDAADPHLACGDLRYEPRTALVAADGGLAAIETIIADAAPRLVAGGWLVLEHGREQGEAVRDRLVAGGFSECVTVPDLAGHDRVSYGCLAGATRNGG